MAAGITHEINTPLTYIKGGYEIMEYDLEELEDSATKESLYRQHQRIGDGLKRISNIIDSMREMSQKSSESKEEANIYETILIAATMAYNRSKHISNIHINGKLFSIDMDKNEENFTALVQKQRIEQVWIIIINNAIEELQKIEDFTNRELSIEISQSSDYVNVKFIDNAGGIKEEAFADLFEPFKSTKEGMGIGIGLSIAKKIVEEQNGTIKAYNQNGGAVFEINLPKKKVQ
jgi:C4-dicarboxylate-specific signal transduction histidine kinase